MSHPSWPTALPGYTSHFATAAGYLDFGRFGPPSIDVVRAMTRVTEQAASGADQDITEVLSTQEQAVGAIAAVLGVPRDQVTFSPSTSAGLFQTAFALPGGGELLAWRDDFPANVYPWLRAADRGGPRVQLLPGPASPSVLKTALSAYTDAVAVSAVDYRTGQRADLPALREVVGDRLLLVDGIQGFGAIDAEWETADVLVVGAQKWLRAGWGAGFIRCSPRALERLGAGLTGWTGVQDPDMFDGRVHPAVSTADRLSISRSSPQAAAGLIAALNIVQQTGVAQIAAAISERVSALIDVLDEAGAELLTPRRAEHRAGIVSFALPGVPLDRIQSMFGQRDLVATFRADHVRLSIHASTPASVIHTVAAALAEARSDATDDPSTCTDR